MQPSQRLELQATRTQTTQPAAESTIRLTPFDRKEYRALIEAGDQTLRRIVKRLKPALGLSAAVDAGCGGGALQRRVQQPETARHARVRKNRTRTGSPFGLHPFRPGYFHGDFIKLDAEGAELLVLYGAMKLLNRTPRPAMLVEVQDIRTKPWGYAA